MKKLLIVASLLICFQSYSQEEVVYDYCFEVTEEIDDYTNKKSFSTPMYNFLNTIGFSITKYSKTSYYLYLSTESTSYDLNAKNICIIFKDGTKFIRNVKVDVNYYSGGSFTYSASFKITEKDVKLFASKEIERYKVDRHQKTLQEWDSMKLKAYSSCILNK